MGDVLGPVGVVLGAVGLWFALSRWILPAFGIGT
jgi:hypothetical protein